MMERPILPQDRPVPPALASHMAPLSPFLERHDVLEICINRPGEVWVERSGLGMVRFEAPRIDDAPLFRAPQVELNYATMTLRAPRMHAVQTAPKPPADVEAKDR